MNCFEKCVIFDIYQTSESSEGKIRLTSNENLFPKSEDVRFNTIKERKSK